MIRNVLQVRNNNSQREALVSAGVNKYLFDEPGFRNSIFDLVDTDKFSLRKFEDTTFTIN